MEIVIDKPTPKQLEILKNKKRNKFLLIARRWGKTTFSSIIVIRRVTSHAGFRAAWSAPTWKLMQETFEYHRKVLEPAISRVNREDRRIELINESVIEYWSSDDPSAGRGRKYHLWVSDETQRQNKLMDFIKGSVRPCLADYRGELWILGTPNGEGSEFHTLYEECVADEANWYVARGKLEDNPYIDPAEIALMREQLGPYAAQEIDAQWIRIDGVAPLISKLAWDQLYGTKDNNTAYRILALDASVSGDTTSLLGIWKDFSDHYYTDYSDIFCWHGEPEIDFEQIENTIFNLFQTGKYAALAYDPYQSVYLSQRLRARGIRTVEFTQNSMRLKADSYLKQILNQERYHHPGHLILDEHVLNATLKYAQNESIRIVKSNPNKKIDLAVALSMAMYTHNLLNPSNVSPFTPLLAQGLHHSPNASQPLNPLNYLKGINPFRER